MLLRFKVKNFLSFYEETIFDMFPNLNRKTFPNHVYSKMEVPLLKQAAIYGANGSGKSNLVKAIKLLRSIILDKSALTKTNIAHKNFKLAGKTNEEPTYLSMEFFISERYYIYNVEFDAKQIIKEELLLSNLGQGENDIVFTRNHNSFSSTEQQNHAIIEATTQLIKKNPLSSLMSMIEEFPIFSDENISLSKKWFTQLGIVSLSSVHPYLISLMSSSQDFLRFINTIITKIGLGMENVDVHEENLNDIILTDFDDLSENSGNIKTDILKSLENDGIISTISDDERVLYNCENNEQGEKIVKSLLFEHIGLNGYSGKLGFDAQSHGTVRILNLLPAIYSIIHEQCVCIIDEIESGIHPNLIRSIIKYLSEIETKGQLIFTTHESMLLDQQELMRPDEVWFTEKDKGQTKMYSLNDFKLHNTINIRNGYLEGRYGAIPIIGNLND